MNSWLIIGGPIVATLTAGFLVWSGILVFGDVDGLEYEAGAESAGTFSLEEGSTSFAEVEGLGMEIEQESIEYREGDESTTVRKLNGLSKYTNITLRRPTGFDWKAWKFMFEREAAIETVESEYDEKLKDMQNKEVEETGEMYQIEPPTLVIPVR